MKFNNGYNEVLFPVKSPVNDQSIVQMRQIIIFWHFDLFLLLFARWYTPIYRKILTQFAELSRSSFSACKNRYMPKIHPI